MMMFFSGLGPLIVLWIGGGKIIAGQMSLGDFVAFNGYLLYLVFPTFALGWIINVLRRGMVAMERLKEVLAVSADLIDRPGTALGVFEGKIEVHDLTFSYDRLAPPVLRNISFKIEPGRRLGIIGLTGSGKSTLAGLLARQWVVEDGHILFDGREVNSLPLRQLRRRLGYLPQEAFVFSKSIRENLSFIPREISEEDIDRALELSGLKSEVQDLPDGLDTILGERGVNLSGGQRQRLALARTLLADPEMLILDDPLSQVDAETEQQILAALKSSIAETTTVIIAHRISTVMDSDEILVLDDGEVIERGTHKELMALNGLYARIFRHQQLEASLEKIQ
jgi:ATP-binding cassette subfamily B protein